MNQNSVRGRVRNNSTNNDTDTIAPKAPECAVSSLAAPKPPAQRPFASEFRPAPQYRAAHAREHPATL